MFEFCEVSTRPGVWYHTCFNIENLVTEQRMKLVFNGHICLDKVYKDGTFDPIRMERNLTLGVRQKLSRVHLFGKFAHLNIWNRSLGNDEMVDFTSRCPPALNKSGTTNMEQSSSIIDSKSNIID